MDETILTSPAGLADETRDIDAGRPAARDETRDLIVSKAAELFAHYGYSKTNIGDIASGCGMSPGNLYRYFRNKQAIGHAVIRCYFEEDEARVTPILSAPDLEPEQRLRALLTESIMHTVDHLRVSPKIVELAEMICETQEGVAMVQEHVGERRRRLAAVIAEGIERGVFRVADPLVAAQAVQMGTKFFHVPFAIARHGLDNVEEDLRITLDLLCAGLRHG